MGWVIGIIVVLIFLAFIIAIVFLVKYDRKNHKDNSKNQTSDSIKINYFAPANDIAGIQGEMIVNYHLKSLLKEDEYLLTNLLLPLKNGYKTEIDCVLITRKGIFCIETKNWVGHIIGSDDDEYWIQKYDDPFKSDKKRRNPVRQNDFHCDALERVLNDEYNVDGAVIFVKLEDGSMIDSDYTYSINGFKWWYASLEEYDTSSYELKEISQLLNRYVATPEQLKEHRKSLEKRFNN